MFYNGLCCGCVCVCVLCLFVYCCRTTRRAFCRTLNVCRTNIRFYAIFYFFTCHAYPRADIYIIIIFYPTLGLQVCVAAVVLFSVIIPPVLLHTRTRDSRVSSFYYIIYYIVRDPDCSTRALQCPHIIIKLVPNIIPTPYLHLRV